MLTVDRIEQLLAMDKAPLAPIAAGVVIRAPSGNILFLKRGKDEKNYASHWCLPGGGIDEGESPKEAARREVREETGYQTGDNLYEIAEVETGTGTGTFVTFGFDAPEEFKPTLEDKEHVAYAWAPPSAYPDPMHPGVEKLMRKIKNQDFKSRERLLATDRNLSLALDRDSVRTKDHDGRLHVSRTNISKANVCPYKGSEIPDWQNLGLDPNRIYMLLRDPEELKKAAPTFNGLPILRKHIPVSADDHVHEHTVGSTGSLAEFDGEYLTNAISIWPGEDIAGIEDDSKKELSSGYHYRADMTPGNFHGSAYDGVMRDIVGNHVALVTDGRAGPDVVVGDSNEEIAMSNRELAARINAITTRTVSVAALTRYLQPKLALDAKPSGAIAKVFAGVTGTKFESQRKEMAKRIVANYKPLLAQDITLDDTEIEKVLERLTPAEKEVGDAEVMEPEHNAMEAAAGEIGEPAGEEFIPGDNGMENMKGFLKSKGMGEDDINQACKFLESTQGAKDEFPPAKKDGDKDDDDKDEAKAKDAEPMNAITKPAMDAAIKAASEATRKEVIAAQRDIRKAENEVRPYVGELSLAFDSADEVYRHALGILGVAEAKTIHSSALPTILAMQPRAGAKPVERNDKSLGMDSSAMKGFAERFPEGGRVGRV